jgi:hypothetical protein
VITVSISNTVLNPFSERPEIGAKKLPAAPQITKSIRPNLSMVFATAACSASGRLTSPWAGMQVCPVASESSFEVWVSRSSLDKFF